MANIVLGKQEPVEGFSLLVAAATTVLVEAVAGSGSCSAAGEETSRWIKVCCFPLHLLHQLLLSTQAVEAQMLGSHLLQPVVYSKSFEICAQKDDIVRTTIRAFHLKPVR